ncbi:hypothetical protein [Salinisphaera aquimarina]|uniref:Uncharacterized protein n=1 Tax=Salinisphaera aquimarina TaxID=2094031 RepID=A0ABV7EK99_9GAMM
MITSISVLLAPIIAAYVGNRLLTRWQLRTWLYRRQVLQAEREYELLQTLTDKISQSIAARIFAMQRVAKNAGNTDQELFEKLVKDYNQELSTWNQALVAYCVSLNHLSAKTLAHNLEHVIQPLFVQANSSINKIISAHRGDVRSAEIAGIKADGELNSIQGHAGQFVDHVQTLLQETRTRLFGVNRVVPTATNLQRFTTWELFKLLWIRDIDSFSVTRSPVDF